MSGTAGYFINRYWIGEYIQYLETFGLVLGCSCTVERVNGPMNVPPWPMRSDVAEGERPWFEGKSECPEWVSCIVSFSVSEHEALWWVMRWVDAVC